MHIVSACLVTFLLLLASLTTGRTAWAHSTYSFPNVTEGQINEAVARLVPLRFLPSHPLYFLITAKETIQRFFQPSAAARTQFDLVLAGKRVKETYLSASAGDFAASSWALKNYGRRLDKLVWQFEKARSQNQEVVPLAERVAEGLKDHEIMLTAIAQKWQEWKDAYGFDNNFAEAVSGFSKVAVIIDNVRPGLKDRFMLVGKEADDLTIPHASPPLIEASGTGRPRRVIF